uniref:DUF389 domain-containing protein n=1 Tax=Anopheles farauti TaxID=69004 RepID=A0A182Q8K0_9DIPT
MAGILFVVHIPSARYERELRRQEQERLAKTATATTEDEKDTERPSGKSEEMEPFVTPQPKKVTSKIPRSSHITKPSDEDGKKVEPVGPPTIKFIDQDGEEIPSKPAESKEGDENEEGADKGKDKKSNFLAEPFDRASALRKSWDGFRDLLGSARKEKTAREEAAEKLTLTGDSSMEEVLKTIITEKRIHTAAWIETDKGNGFHIMFSIESGPICDDVIYMLSSWGVGQRFYSTISITSCTLYSQPPEPPEEQEEGVAGDMNKNNDGGAWNTFLSTVRARLNVAQIVEEVKHDAQVSFDFVSMLAVASILAAFGLVEDSSVFLIASMLISPLMGPIIAVIFGTVVKERTLQLIGLKNEIIGIMLTVTVGFIFGLIVCSIDDRYRVGEGITHEMLARCETHSLLVGIAIALPSGAAVAIAILGENIGSLVGVAISASLLPPAVNAGVLWALSCLYFLFGSEESRYGTLIKTQIYSENQGIELFTLGCMSMSLTLLNIFCIYLAGVVFLIIKEVAPVVPKDQKQFWKHDIKIARDYNRTLHTNDGHSMSKNLMQELTSLHHNNDTIGGLRGDYLLNSASKGNQNTWSPRHNYHQRDHRPTIQELEALYLSLSANTAENQFHYSSHHAAPHFLNFDRLSTSPTQHRRGNSSNPINIHGGISRHSRFTESLRGASAPLSKILEDVAAGTSGAKGETSHGAHGANKRETRSYGLPGFKRSSKKFTVTPAYDPIQKE